jgi:tRNA G18 (ribose-2'-O)-methylase SpoU
MRSIILIAHDIRSTYNVGSLLRTADGLGIDRVYLTGYTPYPLEKTDTRLPHIAQKLDAAIHKTALGAEKTVVWKHEEDIFAAISELKEQGYVVCALEQTPGATTLDSFTPPEKCAVIVGAEVTGISEDILKATDMRLVIPMFGKKESFNVAAAAAMALYQLRFKS